MFWKNSWLQPAYNLRSLIHEETLSNMPYQFYSLSSHGGKSPIHGKAINVGFIFPQLVKKKTT